MDRYNLRPRPPRDILTFYTDEPTDTTTYTDQDLPTDSLVDLPQRAAQTTDKMAMVAESVQREAEAEKNASLQSSVSALTSGLQTLTAQIEELKKRPTTSQQIGISAEWQH